MEWSNILCPSDAQSPRSMSLQRSLQNGRNFWDCTQGTDFWQIGHWTTLAVLSVFIANTLLIENQYLVLVAMDVDEHRWIKNAL